MGESGVRVIIQSREQPVKHVVMGLGEFDDLVRFVEENRKEISEATSSSGNQIETQKRQDRAMARRARRMKSYALTASTLPWPKR